MALVLGIDAAWTVGEPSGVALVRGNRSGWQCLAVAPSYESFLGIARGEPIPWDKESFRGSAADTAALLDSAEQLGGSPVDVVAIDMPVATVPISSRRRADNEISTEFGSRWCSTHTPSIARPGPLGRALSESLLSAGYPIRTANAHRNGRRLLEVYPHPALLSLLASPRRVPYKVSKTRNYWPAYSVTQRIEALLAEFANISSALVAHFGDIGVKVPRAGSVTRLSRLKKYEDALDSLVCAWVGAEHLAGRTVALGDDTAAIWCPANVVLDPLRAVT